MELGKYGPGNTNFAKYQTKKFPLHLFNAKDYPNVGCGASCLSLLTGVDPMALRGKNGHFSDNYMINYLRKNKISVFQINQANLTNQKQWEYKIDDRNIILYSSLIRKKEASWFITYGGFIFHNFVISPAHYINFLASPLLSMYCLWSNKWEKSTSN